MKPIQPLEIWSDGETKTAVCIRLYISYDDLANRAVLQYSLCDVDGVTIYSGQLEIMGEDYLNWGVSNDSNLEAYIIAAVRLNITLI